MAGSVTHAARSPRSPGETNGMRRHFDAERTAAGAIMCAPPYRRGLLHFAARQRIYLRGVTKPGVRTGAIPNLAPKWKGPYKLISRVGLNVYWVDRRGKPIKAHTNQIRPVPTPYAELPQLGETSPRRRVDATQPPEMDDADAPDSPARDEEEQPSPTPDDTSA